MLTDLGYVQIPLLASMLLGGCAAKLGRAVQRRSIDAGLGPTALFPLRLRRPAAAALCAVECAFGIGLILTCGQFGVREARLVRLGTGLLFVVATCTLIELRNVRPDIGCGCFGEFSASPITSRTLARSALLAVAAFGSMAVHPIELPRTAGNAAQLLGLFAAELAGFGLLSPEIREVLVRIGYSKPCELRLLSQEQSLGLLARSAQWRRHGDLLADQQPSDTWRELCWWYFAFPSAHAGRNAELVFAMYLQHRRPTVLTALVDSATGAVLSWPAEPARPVSPRSPRSLRPRLRTAPVARSEMPSRPLG